MFCGSCGTENTADAKFCRNCGRPLSNGKQGEAVTKTAGEGGKGLPKGICTATEITEMTNDVENELIWNTIICILFVKLLFCE